MKKLILILSSLAFTACVGSYWIQNNSGAPANIAGETIENGQCKEVDEGDFPVSVKTKDAEGNYKVDAGKIGDEDNAAHYIWDGTSATEVSENKEDDFVEKCKSWEEKTHGKDQPEPHDPEPKDQPEGANPNDTAAKSAVGVVNSATANLQAKVKEIKDAQAIIDSTSADPPQKKAAEEAKEAALNNLATLTGAVNNAIAAAEAAKVKEGVSNETKAAVKAAVDAAKAAIKDSEKVPGHYYGL